MLKWLALWTFFAFLATGDAMPKRITENSSVSSHRNRRMINGTLVLPGQPLWQVGLRAYINHSWYYAGGGSIISREWAVTVAHCVCNGSTPDPSILTVSVGSIQVWEGSVHWINKIICHPSYRNVLQDRPTEYDIAVIRVYSQFKFDATTNYVSLPSSNGNIVESVGVVYGWGSTQPDGIGISRELRGINMKILPASTCNMFIRNGYGVSAEDVGQICAQGLFNSNICYGDSGGGLVVHGVLVGIAAWISGDLCVITENPAVFTSIYTFRNWIKNTTGV